MEGIEINSTPEKRANR